VAKREDRRPVEQWSGQRWMYWGLATLICLAAPVLWLLIGIGCEQSDPGTQSDLYFARCDVGVYRHLPLLSWLILSVGFMTSAWMGRWWPRNAALVLATACLIGSWRLFSV
jgi:hypothetical protein